MSKRIRMRRSHPELSIVDSIVINLIHKKLSEKKNMTLLDAGCGTGERLKMIFERGKLPLNRIEVIGVDFCEPLVEEARTKTLNNRSLYTSVLVEDLENFHLHRKFDIVVGLFSVLNNIGVNYKKALLALSNSLEENGFLVFDFVHPQAASQLFGKTCKHLVNKYGPLKSNEYYYERQFDHSEGKAYIFTLQDITTPKDKKLFLLNSSVEIESIYDINTYRTKRGKFALAREYLHLNGSFIPNHEKYKKTWLNSILVAGYKRI